MAGRLWGQLHARQAAFELTRFVVLAEHICLSCMAVMTLVALAVNDACCRGQALQDKLASIEQ